MFRLISDVHGEQFNMPWDIPVDSTIDEKNTVLLLAGDMGVVKRPSTIRYLLEDASERFKSVVYIMGNHEHYGSTFNETADKINTIISTHNIQNIHFDTHISIDIGEYTIIAATLWTSFNNNSPMDMVFARQGMSDYSQIHIKTSNKGEDRVVHRLAPKDVLKQHNKDKVFIFESIHDAIARKRKIIVMSHHAPSHESVCSRYTNSTINHAFYTDLDMNIIELDYEMVWCHGHMHNSSDYMLGKCRVICNPHGYGKENPSFNPLFII